MPKIKWLKEDKPTRNKRLGKDFCDLLNHTLFDKGVKGTYAAQARYLEMDYGTFSYKVKNPTAITIENLWDWIEKLDLSCEQVGKALGCKK